MPFGDRPHDGIVVRRSKEGTADADDDDDRHDEPERLQPYGRDEAQYPERRDSHAEGCYLRRRIFIRQLARGRGNQSHDDRLDQHHEARFARRKAEDRLQVNRQQEADGKCRAVVDHRCEIRQRKDAVLDEHEDGQDGIFRPALVPEECAEKHHPQEQQTPSPGEFRQLRQTEHRKDHRETVEQCAPAIDACHLLFPPFLMQVAQCRAGTGKTDERDGEEDALPACVVIEQSAEYRATGQAHVDHRDHPAERAAALRRRKAERDDRHVRRIHHRCRQALQRTCHEQEAHIRHDGTERGGQCEERRPQEKDAPLAETVCHLAHRQQEYDGGEQKNLEHPAEFISRDAVSESDIRQRERQGTARERRHEGRHHHGQQDLLAIRQSHTIT